MSASPQPSRLLRLRPAPSERPRRGPSVSVHDVHSPRIHPGLDGLRIGQLSDLHARGGVRPRRLELAVELINAQRPDLVVLTGDYVSVTAHPCKALTSVLRKLRAPAYATLGNHDHWAGAQKIRAALWKANIEVLTNEHRVLSHRGTPFHLVGVDDSVTRHADPERAFAGIPEDATRIVLSHDPKSADVLHRYHPALILSGHTHGGQVFFRKLTPFISERIGIKYLSGFFEVNGAVLFVNRGLGAALPLRFRAPMEVACLTLRSSAQARLPSAA